ESQQARNSEQISSYLCKTCHQEAVGWIAEKPQGTIDHTADDLHHHHDDDSHQTQRRRPSRNTVKPIEYRAHKPSSGANEMRNRVLNARGSSVSSGPSWQPGGASLFSTCDRLRGWPCR